MLVQFCCPPLDHLGKTSIASAAIPMTNMGTLLPQSISGLFVARCCHISCLLPPPISSPSGSEVYSVQTPARRSSLSWSSLLLDKGRLTPSLSEGQDQILAFPSFLLCGFFFCFFSPNPSKGKGFIVVSSFLSLLFWLSLRDSSFSHCVPNPQKRIRPLLVNPLPFDPATLFRV